MRGAEPFDRGSESGKEKRPAPELVCTSYVQLTRPVTRHFAAPGPLATFPDRSKVGAS